MYTSMLGLALGAVLASYPVGPSPLWQSDYSQAMTLAVQRQRPMAVMFGHGEAGWDAVVTSGQLGSAITATLRSDYVCVYVNLQTPAGRKLAGEFELDDAPAMVLSDRGGGKQAYRRVGALPDHDLKQVLTRYSDPDRAVTATEKSGIQRVEPAPPPPPVFSPPPPSFCPT